MGNWFKRKVEPGSYKVKGVTPRYWDDDDPSCATRQLLKAETQRDLDEYYSDGYERVVPGAFGSGPPTPCRKKRDDPDTRRLRWCYRLRSKYPNVPWKDW